MGKTVVWGAVAMLAVCGVALLGWLIYTVRAARLDAREALKAIKALGEAFGRGHPYPGPSAAAVVTEPASGTRETNPGQLPEPVHARAVVGLPAVERRLVPVTRDSDPVHTRPTVVEGGETAPSSDQRVVPFDVAMNRPAVPRFDVEDHDTPEEETRIFSGDPDAADAQIPGVEVRPRATVLGLAPCAPTPRTGTPIPPRAPSAPPAAPVARRVPPSMDERISDRYNELCDASNAAGEPADHCEGGMCLKGETALCRCRCRACRTAIAFLFQAQDENPHPTPTPTGRRQK